MGWGWAIKNFRLSGRWGLGLARWSLCADRNGRNLSDRYEVGADTLQGRKRQEFRKLFRGQLSAPEVQPDFAPERLCFAKRNRAEFGRKCTLPFPYATWTNAIMKCKRSQNINWSTLSSFQQPFWIWRGFRARARDLRGSVIFGGGGGRLRWGRNYWQSRFLCA